jgi:hypothetical protein
MSTDEFELIIKSDLKSRFSLYICVWQYQGDRMSLWKIAQNVAQTILVEIYTKLLLWK